MKFKKIKETHDIVKLCQTDANVHKCLVSVLEIVFNGVGKRKKEYGGSYQRNTFDKIGFSWFQDPQRWTYLVYPS